MDLSRALRNFFTGVQRQRAPTMRATLTAAHRAFGTWRAVAAEMGISERTLRRVRTGMVSSASRARIDELSHNPAVRRASVTPAAARRLDRMQTNDTHVVLTAYQGPRGYGQGDYLRLRTIDLDIPPHRMIEMANAFFGGDDNEAVSLFADAIEDYYGEGRIPGQGWIVDEIESISMDV